LFCSFEGRPNILRLYGKGFTVLPGDQSWPEISGFFNLVDSTRQIIVADIHRVQTSCGFGVPLYQYVGERNYVSDFVESKGPEGLKAYMEEKNLSSVDGLPTALAQRRRIQPTLPDKAPGSLLQ
jgi:hypothetical protein